MKRYLLFAGDNHYPKGGWKDAVGSYDLITDAAYIANGLTDDWWHIVDTKTGGIVETKQ